MCLLALPILFLGFSACEPGRALDAAVERTVAAGPAKVEATARRGAWRYRLVGRLDPVRGYRLCAAIHAAPRRYQEQRTLWLEGRNWSYATLTAHGRRCDPGALWLDDHPPTLELVERSGSTWRVPGAEDHLHAALLALTRMADAAGASTTARDCAGSRCFRALVSFRDFDREPARRDEDGWTLRPLLRRLGSRPVAVRVNAAGYVDRLRLSGRVAVGLRLSRFGEAEPVPRVGTRRIAIE